MRLCPTLLISLAVLCAGSVIEDINFLSQYGYIEKSTNAQLRQSDINAIVLKLQKNFHLPETSVLDHLTKKVLSAPQCDRTAEASNDFPRPSSLRSYWNRKGEDGVTLISYNIENYSRSRNLRADRLEHLVRKALSVWEGVANIRFIKDNEKPDVRLSFKGVSHPECYGSFGKKTIAHAYPLFPEEANRHPISGDVHFNDEGFGFTEEMTSTYNEKAFIPVVVHEVGHVLGLNHTDDFNSVMYFAATDNMVPSAEDIRVLNRYFGVPRRRVPHPAVPIAPATRAPPTKRPEMNRPIPPQNPSGKHHHHHHPVAPVRPTTQIPWIPHPTHVDEVIPDPCRSGADAVVEIRGSYLVFRGHWVWRFDPRNIIVPPTKIERLFSEVSHVDAAFSQDDLIYIFSERFMYVYHPFTHGFHLHTVYPFLRMDLPSSVTHIDLAFVEAFSKSAVLWFGNNYWRINMESWRTQPTYPRSIDAYWPQIPRGVRAPFFHGNNIHFYYKSNLIIRLNNTQWAMPVVNGFPLPATDFWGGCPKSLVDHHQLRGVLYNGCLRNILGSFIFLWLAL